MEVPFEESEDDFYDVYGSGGGGIPTYSDAVNTVGGNETGSIGGDQIQTQVAWPTMDDEEQQNFDDFQNLANGSGYYAPTTGDTGVYTDPTTGVQTQGYGDGTYDSYDPNTGAEGYYDTNTGESETVNPDGSGSYTDANGVTTTWDAQGNSQTYGADNSVLNQTADGSGDYTDAQGRKSQWNSQGVLLSYVDPTTGYAYNNNGTTWSENWPDGSICTGDFSGNYCCSDGTCTPAWSGKATNTQYSRTPGPTSGGSGGGGSPRSSSGQQQQPTNPLLNARIPTLGTSPFGASALRASPYAQQSALGLTSAGLSLGPGMTLSWTTLLIGGLLIYAISRK